MRAMATVEMYVARDNYGRGDDDSDDAECGGDDDEYGGDDDSEGDECGGC